MQVIDGSYVLFLVLLLTVFFCMPNEACFLVFDPPNRAKPPFNKAKCGKIEVFSTLFLLQIFHVRKKGS